MLFPEHEVSMVSSEVFLGVRSFFNSYILTFLITTKKEKADVLNIIRDSACQPLCR